jgi:hypothetical protein
MAQGNPFNRDVLAIVAEIHAIFNAVNREKNNPASSGGYWQEFSLCHENHPPISNIM